jgi:hypothetical protein
LSKLGYLRDKDNILLKVENQRNFIKARMIHPFLSTLDFLKNKDELLLEIKNKDELIKNSEKKAVLKKLNSTNHREFIKAKRTIPWLSKIDFLKNKDEILLEIEKTKLMAKRNRQINNDKKELANYKKQIRATVEKRKIEAEKKILDDARGTESLGLEEKTRAIVRKVIQLETYEEAKLHEKIRDEIIRTRSWDSEEIKQDIVEKIVQDDAEFKRSTSTSALPKISFTNSQRGSEYNWHSIYDYYPKSRFDVSVLNEEDIQARDYVYEFKNGVSPEYYAKMFSAALIHKFGNDNLKNKTIVVIPASTEYRTEERFYMFCKKLCEITGAENGYSFITNNEYEREPSYRTRVSANLDEYVEVDEDEIYSKDIIVIDDIRTRGTSSNTIYRLLENAGASNVTFVYLAKTIRN